VSSVILREFWTARVCQCCGLVSHNIVAPSGLGASGLGRFPRGNAPDASYRINKYGSSCSSVSWPSASKKLIFLVASGVMTNDIGLTMDYVQEHSAQTANPCKLQSELLMQAVTSKAPRVSLLCILDECARHRDLSESEYLLCLAQNLH
jgi:hypothetical protein